MEKTSYIGVRLTPDERHTIEQLAKRANTNSAEIVRALVRAAVGVKAVEVMIDEKKYQEEISNVNRNLP